MRSPNSSKSKYGFESVLLGSNENFLRWYNKWYNSGSLTIWKRLVLDDLMAIDKLLKRVEKNAKSWIENFLRDFMGITSERARSDASLVYPFLFDFWHQMRHLDEVCALFTKFLASAVESAYNVVVSAVVLLALVYQYLLGCVDNGGSKTYSSGSLDFRDSFVCIVLFRGAYVWIKFRQAACPANRRKRKSLQLPHQASPFGSHDEFPVSEGGVYRRAVKDKSGTVTHFKYEPRFKPPRQRLDSGTTLKFNCLPLGSYDTDHEAGIVRRIATFYYGKEEGHIQLEDGRRFPIPSMSEQERSLSGKEKADWVTTKTKAVYANILEESKAGRSVEVLNRAALRTNPYFGDATTDPVQSVQIEACAALGTYSTELASLLVVDPLPSSVQFHVTADFDGSEEMIAELWTNDPGADSNGLDSQMHSGGVPDVVPRRGGCIAQNAGGAGQDLEHGEPQLTSPPMESPHGQVNYLQQLVARYKNKLQDVQHQLVEREVQNSNLEHLLMERDVQISNLEQQLMGFKAQNSELQRVVENFKTSTATCTVAPNSQVATWSSFIPDVDIQ